MKPIQNNNETDLNKLMLNIVDDNFIEEGISKLMSFAILASLLSASGIVDKNMFNSNMENLLEQKQVQGETTVTVTKQELGNIVKQSKPKKIEMLGAWEKSKALNVVARTLYMEARGEGIDGLEMVMTVIWNRAKGDPENLVSVCLKRKQFSCWNEISGKTPETYPIQFPKEALSGKGGKDAQMWNICVKIATSAVDGTFVPENSEWNAYYNPSKCNPSWGKTLIHTKMVGNHKVGKLGNPTSSVVSTYTVKPGDTLWSIAGKNMAKVQQIKQLNGLKSNTISPGQVLKLS